MQKFLRMGYSLVFVTMFISLGLCAVDKTHGIAMHGDLKYKQNQSFAYVNPQAPKGGDIRLAVMGTFDSLNPFITKGTPPAGLSIFSERLVFESLMKRSADEPFSLYGLIAENCSIAPDRSFITFYINPKAQWSYGKPVTVDDVIFSFEAMRDKGRINLRSHYAKVDRVIRVDDHTVTFHFKKEADKDTYEPEAPMLIALMPVLPKHFFVDKVFDNTTSEIIPSSGPYRIKDLKLGRHIIYERRPDYWGKDLAVQQGLYNFDTVRFDFYREENTMFEAFKAGGYDVTYVKPADWFDGFNFPAAVSGKVIKQEFALKHPVGMKAMAFNIRRSLFQDIRVREALNHAFDFHWINRTLYHNTLTRSCSYYQNSHLESHGKPNGLELEVLNKYKDQLATEVFLESRQPPESSKSQDVRRHLGFAQRLLKQAGWTVDNKGRLRNDQGQAFEFEMLVYDANDQKIAMAFARSLKTLGIVMNIRLVDVAQYQNRCTTFDFDMSFQYWGITNSPGIEQSNYWGSKAADEPGSRNYIGIKDPVIDALCQQLTTAKDRITLEAVGRSLDRLLVNGYYVIPLYLKEKEFVAYWDKFNLPPYDPKVGIMFAAWWAKDHVKP